jgi:PncC family amidohydrolase
MDAKGYAERMGELLRQRRLSLGIAESCTGGLVSDLVTDVPGSSDYFVGGIVAYSNRSKQQLLGVQAGTLDAHGAVSGPCAAEMAAGARQVLQADLAVSVTGIAGPSGGTAGKPVGLTFLHLSAPDAELGQSMVWQGDRRANKESSALAALQLVVAYLQDGGLQRGPEKKG